jgi:hypothetical protein
LPQGSGTWSLEFPRLQLASAINSVISTRPAGPKTMYMPKDLLRTLKLPEGGSFNHVTPPHSRGVRGQKLQRPNVAVNQLWRPAANHAGVVAPFPGRTRGSTNYTPSNVSPTGPRRAGGEPTWDLAACCAPSARRHWRKKASSTQRSDRRILQTGYEAHKILAAHAKYFFFF